MGYYSSVAIAVKDEVLIEVDVINAFKSLSAIKHLNVVEMTVANGDGENIKYWYCDSIKWYNDEEIICIENFLKELDEDDFGIIRIGEDLNDIECSGQYADFGLEVERSISLPDFMTETK